MMRSMFSGVSGLRAHQTRMDVIGNNVANVNTVAFKSGRATFAEIFSQTLKGASSPDATSGRGGINPMQVGLGLGVGVIETIMTRGSLQTTDNPTDLSIEGEGFFICKAGRHDTFKFTRAGNFGIDQLGNLVTGGGLNVYGWQEYVTNEDGTYTFNTEGKIEPINLYSDTHNKNKKIIAAKATQNAVFAGNLNASMAVPEDPNDIQEEEKFTTPLTVYDSLGNDYQVTVEFWKTSASSSGSVWNWEIAPGTGYTSTVSGSLNFDSKGQLIVQTTPTVIPGTFEVEFIPNEDTGTGPFKVVLDFTNLTSFASDNSVKPTNVDGYPTGTLTTFNIGSDGILTGVYSNGQQQPLGMIALASFTNPNGLQKVGDNLYIPTTNSGTFEKAVKAGSEGVGSLSPGTLEMSNVDLSQEFTNMIITQRGFQANSRIITTSDEMLQELVSLKR